MEWRRQGCVMFGRGAETEAKPRLSSLSTSHSGRTTHSLLPPFIPTLHINTSSTLHHSSSSHLLAMSTKTRRPVAMSTPKKQVPKTPSRREAASRQAVLDNYDLEGESPSGWWRPRPASCPSSMLHAPPTLLCLLSARRVSPLPVHSPPSHTRSRLALSFPRPTCADPSLPPHIHQARRARQHALDLPLPR
jgi:hypothetical protein